MKTKIQHHLRRLILWAAGPYLDEKVDEVIRTLRLGADNAVASQNRRNNDHWEQIRDHVAALQALDVNFQDAGKIVLIARVHGRDIVKIVDVPKNRTLQEWKEMVRDLECRYAAPPLVIDSPDHVTEEYLWEGRTHLRPRKP